MAYFADDRQDLLSGINEFLDCSIVLPPSDVEGKDLLKTVASFQRKMLRKRKEREKKYVSITTASEVEARGKNVHHDSIPISRISENLALQRTRRKIF